MKTLRNIRPTPEYLGIVKEVGQVIGFIILIAVLFPFALVWFVLSIGSMGLAVIGYLIGIIFYLPSLGYSYRLCKHLPYLMNNITAWHFLEKDV